MGKPIHVTLVGDAVVLEPLDAALHAAHIWSAVGGHDELWTYLGDGPFRSAGDFRQALAQKAASSDPLFFAIVDRARHEATGYASYLRIEPAHRVIEVGHILFSPLLRRSRAATEAMYLMARHVFEDLGYRRYEWKCDALNEPSRRAALRLGFTFEGIFRQHMIVKGRNRDTAWFSMIASEWPERKRRLERWLDPSNFDGEGRQRTSLARGTAERDNGGMG